MELLAESQQCNEKYIRETLKFTLGSSDLRERPLIKSHCPTRGKGSFDWRGLNVVDTAFQNSARDGMAIDPRPRRAMRLTSSTTGGLRPTPMMTSFGGESTAAR
jgi:hypothetical protein